MGSGCSRGDRLGKHFTNSRNRGDHVKASVIQRTDDCISQVAMYCKYHSLFARVKL